MKKLLVILALVCLSCDTTVLPDVSTYLCVTVLVSDYYACTDGSIDEIAMNDTILRGWTQEEITAYEQKNSFSVREKCFFQVKVCRCYPIEEMLGYQP